MKRHSFVAAGAAFALCAAASAWAADNQGSVSQNQGSTSSDMSSDRSQSAGQAQSQDQSQSQAMSLDDFRKAMVLNRAHHINQTEIALAKLAGEKAQSPQVKQMAQQILQEHQKADQKFQDLAKSEKVELEDYQPSTYEKVTMDDLRKFNGAQFDQAFTEVMKSSHRMAWQDLKSVMPTVKDPEVRTALRDFLPAIRKHEKMTS